METKIKEIFDIHGYPIDETDQENFENFSYCKFLDFVRKNLLISKKSKIDIFVVNNFQLNAHAIKVSKNQYVILLKSAIIPFAMKTYGNEIKFLKEELKSFGDNEEILGLMIFFTLLYLTGHEFGHIVDGHLEIIGSKNAIDEKSAFDILSVTNLPENIKKEPIIFQHLLELNADRQSISFLAIGIIKLYSQYYQDYNKDTMEDLIKLVVFNIYLLHYKLNLFDLNNKFYPPAYFRIQGIFNDLPYVLNSVLKKNKKYDFEKIIRNADFIVYDYLSDNYKEFRQKAIDTKTLEQFDILGSQYQDNQQILNDFLKKHKIN